MAKETNISRLEICAYIFVIIACFSAIIFVIYTISFSFDPNIHANTWLANIFLSGDFIGAIIGGLIGAFVAYQVAQISIKPVIQDYQMQSHLNKDAAYQRIHESLKSPQSTIIKMICTLERAKSITKMDKNHYTYTNENGSQSRFSAPSFHEDMHREIAKIFFVLYELQLSVDTPHFIRVLTKESDLHECMAYFNKTKFFEVELTDYKIMCDRLLAALNKINDNIIEVLRFVSQHVTWADTELKKILFNHDTP